MTDSMIPTAVAYFEVYVPVTDDTYGERAVELVKNYLYGGFHVVGQRIDFDAENYRTVVTVAFSAYDKARDFRVQYQRDRLSSGLYASSDPVWFDRREGEVS